MARVEMAPGYENMRGSVGNMVFRVVRGQTYAYAKPLRVRQPNTRAQRAVKRKFRRAVTFAKGVMKKPTIWRSYMAEAQKRRTTTIGLITQEWFTPPQVRAIDLSGYQRRAGDIITVVAKGNFKVTWVIVEILADGKQVIEEGAAKRDPISGWWKYTAGANATGLTGLTVRATAWDRPRHTGTLTVRADGPGASYEI